MKKLWIFLFLVILIAACGEAPATELDPIEPITNSDDDANSLNQAEADASPTQTPPPASSDSTGGDTAVDEPSTPTDETVQYILYYFENIQMIHHL